MSVNVERELAAMADMTVPQLREKYAEVFGEPCRSRHKQFLIKRIIWRLQANEQGGLSERARRRAEELANDADIRMCPPKVKVRPGGATAVGMIRPPADRRLPMPGTVLSREYKGRTVRVTVLEDGFEHEGQVYGSLTAVAHKVTGSHWNGFLFFGLVGGREGDQ